MTTVAPPSVHNCDVLIVGAGPNGLRMAAQLRAYGVHVRLVDRALDRVHESRALGVQRRTLKVLRAFGRSPKNWWPAATRRCGCGSMRVRVQPTHHYSTSA